MIMITVSRRNNNNNIIININNNNNNNRNSDANAENTANLNPKHVGPGSEAPSEPSIKPQGLGFREALRFRV